ncbi:MAG: hypothetical protein H0V33_01220 [Acidimicrobiia bacterium]|jgi:hypothetical protein|nr:hypothetical protein [Acidimicrobiia bacterium]
MAAPADDHPTVDGESSAGDGLAAVYDEPTLRRLTRTERPARPVAVPPPGSARRRALGAGAFLTAAALGLVEVFDRRDDEPIVEEIDVSGHGDDDAVQLCLVPGAPRLSRARVRPWLLGR